MPDPDNLLNARGVTRQFEAEITAAAFAGRHAGFALGDGTVRLAAGTAWTTAAAHDGAVLALATHPVAGFLSGGDDGRLIQLGPDGAVVKVAEYGGRWVEQIAAFPGKAPLFAAAVGKSLHLFNGAGAALRTFAHPSTVTGLAFDAKGKRIAAAHYNGASLWFTGSAGTAPRLLEWKGSHLGVALHPGGDALITAMQENALHGWSLPEAKHMRMTGYPTKPLSFGFTASGRWLVTAGAEAAVLWPFFGGGPTGKPPKELGGATGIVRRVACHPSHELFAAGFDTGLVILIDIAKEQILSVCGPGRGEITALAWHAAGSHLAFGTTTGFAALVDLSPSG